MPSGQVKISREELTHNPVEKEQRSILAAFGVHSSDYILVEYPAELKVNLWE